MQDSPAEAGGPCPPEDRQTPSQSAPSKKKKHLNKPPGLSERDGGWRYLRSAAPSRTLAGCKASGAPTGGAREPPPQQTCSPQGTQLQTARPGARALHRVEEGRGPKLGIGSPLPLAARATRAPLAADCLRCTPGTPIRRPGQPGPAAAAPSLASRRPATHAPVIGSFSFVCRTRRSLSLLPAALPAGEPGRSK